MKNFLAIYLGTPHRRRWRSGWPWTKANASSWKRRASRRGAAGCRRIRPISSRPADRWAKPSVPRRKGVSDTKNNMTGYRGGSSGLAQEAAAKMFEKHPHFSNFPGEAVEIMEVLPIPGQPKGNAIEPRQARGNQLLPASGQPDCAAPESALQKNCASCTRGAHAAQGQQDVL